MAEITYPIAIKKDYDKLCAVYSLLEQMRLEHNKQGEIARNKPGLIKSGKWAEYAIKFKAHQLPLLNELINLRKNILDDKIQLWDNLDFDDKIQVWSSILPDKSEEKIKPTKATSKELDEIRLIKIDDIDAIPINDPTEDFTSADWNNGSAQADPNSRLTITASKVACSGLTEDEVMYFYRTHTVSGDFEWLFKITWQGGANGGKVGMPMLGTVVGDMRENPGSFFGVIPYGYESCFSVQSWINGANIQWDAYDAGSGVVTRYVTIDRTSTTFTAKFYTDAARTNLEDTLVIPVTSGDMSYIYAAQSDDSGNASETMSADLEDLDLQEGATEKNSSESGYGEDSKAGYPTGLLKSSEVGNGSEIASILAEIIRSISLYEHYTGYNIEDSFFQIFDIKYGAETFPAYFTHIIRSVFLELSRTGNPGTFTVKIKATSDGKPVGSALATGSINGNDLLESEYNHEKVEISLDGALLVLGNQYAIECSAESGDSNNRVNVWIDSTYSTYTGGKALLSADGGQNWIIYDEKDITFEEWGDVEVGYGIDAQKSLSRVIIGDNGAGADSHKSLSPISVGDTGAGIDALYALIAELLADETGSGVESLSDRDFGLIELGSGVEVSFLSLLSSEAGSGLDTLASLLAAISDSDNGTGTDSLLSLLAEIIKSDSGSGIDNLLSRAFGVLDTGLGADEILSFLRTLSDSGVGAEESYLSAVGRLLALKIKTSQYRKVKQFTSQYRKIKTITF